MATIPFDADQQHAERDRKIKAAMAWLQAAMTGQPRPASEVEAEGLAAGHAHSTLALARKRLHIRSERQGHACHWIPPKARRSQSSAKV